MIQNVQFQIKCSCLFSRTLQRELKRDYSFLSDVSLKALGRLGVQIEPQILQHKHLFKCFYLRNHVNSQLNKWSV